ncbi:hypothetical protein GO496_04215 [Acidovorax citrulli]|nr:hypothetical protein [Paracidovorax citrulli]
MPAPQEAHHERPPSPFPSATPAPDALERDIQARASVAPRVTPADIEAEIVGEHYFTAFDGVAGAGYNAASPDGVLRPFTFEAPGSLGLLTFCVLRLRNGFTVTGESACASPENFNAEIGRRIAKENAVAKITAAAGLPAARQAPRPGALQGVSAACPRTASAIRASASPKPAATRGGRRPPRSWRQPGRAHPSPPGA